MQNIDVLKSAALSKIRETGSRVKADYDEKNKNVSTPAKSTRLNNELNQMSFLGKSQVSPSFKSIQNGLPDVALDKPSSYAPPIATPGKLRDLISSNGALDARFADISKIKMNLEEFYDLQMSNSTVMSDDQARAINTVADKMKSAGLDMGEAHKRFTGKGVRIAVIDQPLSPHQEYSGKVISYEKIGYEDKPEMANEGTMHAAQTVSMISGTNCGVAPDSQIVYFAADNITYDKDDIEKYILSLKQAIDQTPRGEKEYRKYLKQQLKYLKKNINDPNTFVSKNANYTKAIKRVIEENKRALPENRISIISSSWAFDELAPDYPELMDAIKEATEQGIFVVHGSMNSLYDWNVMSADRNPTKDVNDPKSYHEGTYSRLTGFSKNAPDELKNKTLLVPTERRALADYRTTDGYIYNGAADGSGFNAPYIAGMYALMKEANPNITPLEFIDKAKKTSDECYNNDGTFAGRLINPQNLLDSAINSAYVPSSEPAFPGEGGTGGSEGKAGYTGYIPSSEGVKLKYEYDGRYDDLYAKSEYWLKRGKAELGLM